MNAAHSVALMRRAARLGTVQALYQMELAGQDAEEVIEEFLTHRFRDGIEVAPAGDPDLEFFANLVRGVPHRQAEIDPAIAAGLSEGWKLERIDSIIRAILRAAVFELIARPDVPAKVVIDEYVEIAHAFFPGDEPAFVNAILDRIARDKRSPEFGEASQDASKL